MTCRNANFHVLNNLLIPARVMNNSLIRFLDFPWFASINQRGKSWANNASKTLHGDSFFGCKPPADRPKLHENLLFHAIITLRGGSQAIYIADALFMNMDRHMRNFGFIRSAETGRVLRMAPNYDNNQAYTANPGRSYTDAMLKEFFKEYDDHKTML